MEAASSSRRDSRLLLETAQRTGFTSRNCFLNILSFHLTNADIRHRDLLHGVSGSLNEFQIRRHKVISKRCFGSHIFVSRSFPSLPCLLQPSFLSSFYPSFPFSSFIAHFPTRLFSSSPTFFLFTFPYSSFSSYFSFCLFSFPTILPPLSPSYH